MNLLNAEMNFPPPYEGGKFFIKVCSKIPAYHPGMTTPISF